MELNVSRFFSDRVIFDGQLRIKNSLWDWFRWIWSPKSYSDENRKSIACFKKYVIDALGSERFQRICHRYALDFDQMEKAGAPLLSRSIAKIVIGSRDVQIQDIPDLPQLNCRSLAEKIDQLRSKLPWEVPPIPVPISGAPTEWISSIFHDRFLADRERLQLCQEHADERFNVFIHHLLARVIKRELEVGTLIQAPNNKRGDVRFYYVAAKVITGEGMVSYILKPVTADTDLHAMRVFRGTAPRSSDIDAISCLITDMESDLGRGAYESGKRFEKIIETHLGQPEIEAGHSLGSTIVQYRLANMQHIRKAYLFCGPGLPENEVKKFNKKAVSAHMTIRHMKYDRISRIGKIHLGYGLGKVVDFLKFSPKNTSKESPHVQVCSKERGSYGIEGGFSQKQLDLEFYNKDGLLEKIRSILGPVLSLILRVVRFISRTLVPSRADLLKGVQIGSFHGDCFQVEHFR